VVVRELRGRMEAAEGLGCLVRSQGEEGEDEEAAPPRAEGSSAYSVSTVK